MIDTVEFLSGKSFTIPALRERAAQVGISVPSKAKKAEIAQLIADALSEAYTEAESVGRAITVKKIANGFNNKTRNERRINNYIRQRGTDKLTAAQWRRIRKGLRKANLTIGKLSVNYV